MHASVSSLFTDAFDGTALFPGDAGFTDACAVHNAAHNRTLPAVIVRPRSAHGVAQAVLAAQRAGLKVAVRSGGHSPAGYGTVSGGLVLDLRGLNALTVDPATRRVTVQPGLTWGDVAHALHPHGLAITSGDVASVGVGGLTQGGGIGWFARRYGLTTDRLRAVELVTARGEIIRASETERPEVFWAVRGAGATLGVITSLDFEAHEGGLVHGGMLAFEVTSPAQAAQLMTEFARRAHLAPETLTLQGLFMAAPPAPFVPPHLVGRTIFAVLGVDSADPQDAGAAFAPIRALCTPVVDTVSLLPYPAIFEYTREPAMPGFRHATRSGFLPDLPLQAALALGQEVQQMDPGVIVQLRPLGGALGRAPHHESAFSHRHAPFLLMTTRMIPQDLPAELDEVAWATVERLWAPFAPHSAGLYGNFATERDHDAAQATYPAQTRRRLAALKAHFDPHGLFTRNVHVQPSSPELTPA